MRTRIVAGNWKMNKTLPQGLELIDQLITKLRTLQAQTLECKVVVAPPYALLAPLAQKLQGSSVLLAAQDCSAFQSGAYTGEVSAEMLHSCGCGAVIIGHSERRAYHAEGAQLLTEKVKRVFEQGMQVIFCVGENREQRESQQHFAVVEAQVLDALSGFSAQEMSQVILAYEPVWAIGTGLTATPQQAQEIHAHLRSVVAKKWGDETAEATTILYGGSCKPTNAAELFACPDVDGGLIGGAALDADKFFAIIQARG